MCTRAGFYREPALARHCTGIGPNGEAPREVDNISDVDPARWFSAGGAWERIVRDYFGEGRPFDDVTLRSCPQLMRTPFALTVLEGFEAHRQGWRVPVETAPAWWRRTMLMLQADADARAAALRAVQEEYADG